MIVTWMAAAILFALLLGVAAATLESAARLFSRPGRQPWAAALGVSLVWPVLVPLLARERVVWLKPIVVGTGAVRSFAAQLPALPMSIAARLDTASLALWALASLLLVARLLRSQLALLHVSRSSRAARVDGYDVLMTENIGPAVVGIARPRIAVPHWLIELDPPLRELVLRHEREHCRSRDTILLWLGEAGVALMPWNPAVWWQARRLRLALELDCDARTLGASDAVAMYGTLLLVIAERQRMTRLAPMLAESNSHLSRRISAMTRQSVTHRPVRAVALGVVAVVAIVAACSQRVGSDLTGPEPTGGTRASLQPGKTPQLSAPGTVYKEYQIEQAAAFAQASGHPVYPEILKHAGVTGEVIASMVVDTFGLVDPSTLRIIKSSHQLFTQSVESAIPSMRFTPARVGGRGVKQLVMLPFQFQIPDSARVTGSVAPAKLSGPAIIVTPSRP